MSNQSFWLDKWEKVMLFLAVNLFNECEQQQQIIN